MEINEIKQFCNKVNGWLSDKEGEFLYNAARKANPDGVIVEIGSWQGKSTIWLAHGSKSGNRVSVYAIDPHTGSKEHQLSGQKIWTFEKFKENIKNAGVEDVVIPIVKTSEEANKGWEKPISLLWIDGAHEYEFVRKDFELWSPFLIEGGMVAFHDSIGGWPGVRKLTREKIYKDKRFVDFKTIDSILAATKNSNPRISKRIKKRLIIILREIKISKGLGKQIIYRNLLMKIPFLLKIWRKYKSKKFNL